MDNRLVYRVSLWGPGKLGVRVLNKFQIAGANSFRTGKLASSFVFMTVPRAQVSGFQSVLDVEKLPNSCAACDIVDPP